MESWNSFLQTVFQFVKSLFVNVSKKMHRNAVVLTTGVAVVTVVTFTAGDFHGGGKSALVAFAETPQTTDETEAELEETQAVDGLEALPVIAEAEGQEAAKPESKETETADEETSEAETSETESLETGSSEPEMSETEKTETAEAGPGQEPAEKSAKETPEDGAGTEGTPGESAEENGAQSTEPGGTEGVPAQSGLKEIAENENATGEAAEVFACSSSDYRVLLKIVQAEAGICDTKGRILVANVILNRVKSDEFPDTIPGVVYQKSQFSPVIDGSIDTCKVTQETVDAVDRALAGEDYSQGALYFMNRRTSSKKNVRWFDSRLEYLFKHGDHEFFK